MAVYTPPPKTVVKVTMYQIVRERVIPPGAGAEFRFKVRADDAMEAVEIVRHSGFFLDHLAQEFGFCTKEVVAA